MAAVGSVSAVGGDQRVSGDIRPGPRELLIRLDPLTAPRRTQALAALCDQLTAAGARYPGTDLVLCYAVKIPPKPRIKISLCGALMIGRVSYPGHCS